MSTPGVFTNSSTIIANTGNNTIDATVAFINNGVVQVTTGATETITTPLVGGTGSMQISTGGDLVLNVGSVQVTQTIFFTDSAGFLDLGPNAIGGFDAIISGFQVGDHITVQTTAAATFQRSGSIVSVVSNGISIGDLEFATSAQAFVAIS